MSATIRWPRAVALGVASKICAALDGACERIVVAGSLRRGRADVGDVEILFVPKFQRVAVDMFATADRNLAEAGIADLLAIGDLRKRASVTGGQVWGKLNKLAVHHSGVPVDLFTASSENWWNFLVCRTGPAGSNMRIATAAKARGYRWNPYGAGFTRLADGASFPMATEEAVFDFVGLPFLPPEGRA